MPWNNYGWSKLGAESAVQMYKNSLIVRACMTEKPFTHKFAFSNVKSNFIFHDQFAKLLIKTIPLKGIINIGGKSQSIYKFAKSSVKNIKSKKSQRGTSFENGYEFKQIKRVIKKMKVIKTNIKNLLIIKQKNNIDARGRLRETFNKKILNKKFIFEYCTNFKS